MDALPYVAVTTKEGPLCTALTSKADVKAHTAEYVTGNQWPLMVVVVVGEGRDET